MSAAVLLGRMALSLLVVLVLMGAVAHLARRRGGLALGGLGKPGTRTGRLQIVSRHNVAKSSSLAVVRVGGRELLIGVTPSTISLLIEAEEGGLTAQADPATIPEAAQGSASLTPGFRSPSPWTVMVDQLRERTVRRA